MGDIRRLRSSAIWLVLIVAVIALWFLVVNDNDSTTNKDFAAVAADINDWQGAERLSIGENSQHSCGSSIIDPDTNDAKIDPPRQHHDLRSPGSVRDRRHHGPAHRSSRRRAAGVAGSARSDFCCRRSS